jgi:hypothetical protein
VKFTQLSCFVYSSTLETETIFSSETSVDFHRTMRRYIPEGRTLLSHRCENLISSIAILCSRNLTFQFRSGAETRSDEHALIGSSGHTTCRRLVFMRIFKLRYLKLQPIFRTGGCGVLCIADRNSSSCHYIYCSLVSELSS